MNELLSGTRVNAELDPVGSLVDGDMGSYYTYLNQQRLTGAEKSSFLVWFEGHNQALAIGPAMPRGTSVTLSRSPRASRRRTASCRTHPTISWKETTFGSWSTARPLCPLPPRVSSPRIKADLEDGPMHGQRSFRCAMPPRNR